MPTILTPEQLKSIFSGQNLSLAYNESVRLYYRLQVHANGDIPIWLIRDARPNESDAVRDYRQKIYEAETQNPIERVFGVLKKIRRSPDWMMRFENDSPAIINNDETLEKYLTENYPKYKHIEDWLFEEALRNLGVDANAMVVVMPETLDPPENAYLKPICHIYNADRVLQFVSDDYAVLKSDEVSSLLTPEEQRNRLNATAAINSASQTINPSSSSSNAANNSFYQFGSYYMPNFTAAQVYYFINTIYYQKWEETSNGKYQLTKVLQHNLNELPVFQMPGTFLKRLGSSIIRKTLLNPMVPHLNKAARESNDLDAGVIMHLFLEKWRINNVPCAKCNGTGKCVGESGPTNCTTCNGTGLATGKSPFNEIVVKPASIGQQQTPVPPVGYVDKNPEILKLQNDRIEQHIYRSLASVNMEHLSDVQLNQSGTAKAFDRDEAGAVVYAFATDLAYIENTAIYFINKLRNGNLIANKDELKSMLPVIPIPEKFDVINTTFLLQEYQSAKTAGLNSIILSELQKEISEKKFYGNPKVADYVKVVMEVDPFPDKTIEEKALLEGQGLVTKQDIVLSNYISYFVNQAMEENPMFGELSRSKKLEILLKYTDAKVKELSSANQVMQDILQQNNQAVDGQNQNDGQQQQQDGQSGKPQPTQQQLDLKNFSSQLSTVKRIGNTNL